VIVSVNLLSAVGDPRLSKGELFVVGGCVGVVLWLY